MKTIIGIEVSERVIDKHVPLLHAKTKRMISRVQSCSPEQGFIRFQLTCITYDICAYWATGRASPAWCRAFIKADPDSLCSYVVARTKKDCSTAKIIAETNKYLRTYHQYDEEVLL